MIDPSAAEFRRRRRRQKSLAPPTAEFWSARRRASRIWTAPAGKVTAARLRGISKNPKVSINVETRTQRKVKFLKVNAKLAIAQSFKIELSRRTNYRQLCWRVYMILRVKLKLNLYISVVSGKQNSCESEGQV